MSIGIPVCYHTVCDGISISSVCGSQWYSHVIIGTPTVMVSLSMTLLSACYALTFYNHLFICTAHYYVIVGLIISNFLEEDHPYVPEGLCSQGPMFPNSIFPS